MDKDERIQKLHALTKQNLDNTLRMLHYNLAHEIEVYRMSSSLVPLATHPEVKWDFRTAFKDKFLEIGDMVKKHKLRVSFHPNQFTLFTSDKRHITNNAVIDMEYHYEMFEAMGLGTEGYMNIHVGGAYGDKTKALERFHKNIKKLPSHIKKQMTLENDDKTYTADETLTVCEKENIPMVFDYHHHMANLGEMDLLPLIERAFSTWKDVAHPPKVHISSPKTEKEFRSHADYVDLDFIMPFLKATKELGIDYDIMIEAKQKDKAMLALIEEVAKIRGIKRIRGGSVVW